MIAVFFIGFFSSTFRIESASVCPLNNIDVPHRTAKERKKEIFFFHNKSRVHLHFSSFALDSNTKHFQPCNNYSNQHTPFGPETFSSTYYTYMKTERNPNTRQKINQKEEEKEEKWSCAVNHTRSPTQSNLNALYESPWHPITLSNLNSFHHLLIHLWIQSQSDIIRAKNMSPARALQHALWPIFCAFVLVPSVIRLNNI